MQTHRPLSDPSLSQGAGLLVLHWEGAPSLLCHVTFNQCFQLTWGLNCISLLSNPFIQSVSYTFTWNGVEQGHISWLLQEVSLVVGTWIDWHCACNCTGEWFHQLLHLMSCSALPGDSWCPALNEGALTLSDRFLSTSSLWIPWCLLEYATEPIIFDCVLFWLSLCLFHLIVSYFLIVCSLQKIKTL